MSSRRFFEYRCSDDHVSELLVYPDVPEIHCLTCGKPATKVISAVRSRLEGITGAFPTAADRWATVHEQATRQARKRKQDHSDPDA